MLLFLLLTLAILGHGYLVVAVINRLHGCPGSKKVINSLTKVCFAIFFSAPIVVAWNWQSLNLSDWNDQSTEVAWLKNYIYFCAVWGILKLIKRVIGDPEKDRADTLLDWKQEPSKYSQHLNSLEFHGSYSQMMAKLPYNQSLQLTIDRKKLRVPRLHSNHEGLKIAHLSDLHMTGRIGRALYEAMVQQVNALEPDVIAITGDIIENRTCMPWLTEILLNLQAKIGIYFVLGNHDYYIDSEETKSILVDGGMQYVANEPLFTEWNNHPVVLAGNERPWGVVSDVSGLDDQDKEKPLRFFLLHSPDRIGWACQHDADLALAGHTHGGQFRFPVLGPLACPSLYGTRYACGVFRKCNTVMHVSRGLSGKLTLRWNCPPEIALLELTSN